MSHIYAATGAITSASRLVRDLSKMGIDAAVTHTPKTINKGGCSYSVKVKEKNRQHLENAASLRNITIKKWYRDGEEG